MWVLVFHRNQNELVHVSLLMLRFIINPHKCRVHQIWFTLVKKWAMRAIISVQRQWWNLQGWPYTWYRSGENHCVSQNCQGEYFSWVVIATTSQLKKYLLYFIHIVIIVEFRYSFFLYICLSSHPRYTPNCWRCCCMCYQWHTKIQNGK